MRRFVVPFLLLFTACCLLFSCANLKTNHLFDYTDSPGDSSAPFYASSEIYHDFLTSEAWFTNNYNCLNVTAIKEARYKGDYGLHVVWDRQLAGCPWLGLGFGWDNWNGKDLSEIKNVAAIEFWIRTVEGKMNNLPWAIGLEDFNGAQAWLGMTPNSILAEYIDTSWTRIVLPLSEFNWDEQNADPTLIKQIIFNMEASGEIYMDEVSIVPYEGGFRKRAYIPLLSQNDFKPDGLKNDSIWKTKPLHFGKNIVHLALIDSFFCVALEVLDESPLQNANNGDKSWDGDAFEIVFSTDDKASPRRIRYLSSDQHIGFALGNEISVWDWRKHTPLKKTVTTAVKTENGYVFEAMISLNELDVEFFVPNILYGLDMAVDHGDLTGRKIQERWNDHSDNGQFDNPFMWGEMNFLPSEFEEELNEMLE